MTRGMLSCCSLLRDGRPCAFLRLQTPVLLRALACLTAVWRDALEDIACPPSSATRDRHRGAPHGVWTSATAQRNEKSAGSVRCSPWTAEPSYEAKGGCGSRRSSDLILDATGAACAGYQQDKPSPQVLPAQRTNRTSHAPTPPHLPCALGGRESGRETNWHISLGELLGARGEDHRGKEHRNHHYFRESRRPNRCRARCCWRCCHGTC